MASKSGARTPICKLPNIEHTEQDFPLLILYRKEMVDSGGAGKWRGGLGSVREFTFLSDGGASVEGEGHRYRPWGFLGGKEGMPAKLDLMLPGSAPRPLPSKVPHMNIGKDGSFVCYGPAGGGYGDPHRRAPAKVAEDVALGLVSASAAREIYGVALKADGSVDEAETARLRTKVAAE